ncbi:hypothetical protein FACS1894160_0330 [Bacteroidia bacterium]|nr:hypothetical protein FACS1894160_0330 [Bacteroidia bacterium]
MYRNVPQKFTFFKKIINTFAPQKLFADYLFLILNIQCVMKIINGFFIKIILFFLLPVTELSAQITIGSSEEPVAGASLQLKEISGVTDDSPDAYKGLAMPRVHLTDENNLYPMFLDNTADPASGPNASYAADKSTLDKLHTGLIVYNSNDAALFKKGLYVWSGSKWEPAGSADVENGLTLSGGTVQLGGALTKATTVTLGDNNLYLNATGAGKVGIGSAPASSSAILEINAADKGVLLPRVALTSNTDNTTVPNPALGLLVYNTGTGVSPTTGPYTVTGYLFWSGSSWKTIDNFEAVQPVISAINCGTAQLSPGTYTSGTPYSGIMRLHYTGGNGASYTSGSTYTNNGLTAELQSGRLENGNGELIFKVTGTPTLSSPNTTTFLIDNVMIPFYTGSSCNVEVGASEGADVKTVAVMKPFTRTDDLRTGYQVVATTPDGKFSVRIFVPSGINFENANLQIKSNGVEVTIASNEATTWAGGSGGYARNNFPVATSWCGNANNANNNDESVRTIQNSSNFPSWGDQAVYYTGRPEYRTYSWTSKDQNDKVFYTFRFMMMAPSGSTEANTSNCPSGTCTGTKAFFLIEQITAQ